MCFQTQHLNMLFPTLLNKLIETRSNRTNFGWNGCPICGCSLVPLLCRYGDPLLGEVVSLDRERPGDTAECQIPGSVFSSFPKSITWFEAMLVQLNAHDVQWHPLVGLVASLLIPELLRGTYSGQSPLAYLLVVDVQIDAILILYRLIMNVYGMVVRYSKVVGTFSVLLKVSIFSPAETWVF